MVNIKIKPISINEAYRGRRFATSELKSFKEHLFCLLNMDYKFGMNGKQTLHIPKGKIFVKYTFGCSSKGSDGDNLIKVFQDCLAQFYGFNDNKIYKWVVEKVDVKKGEEFIGFEIKEYDN